MARVLTVEATCPQDAPALLGAQEPPKLSVRKAMAFYFDTMAVDEMRGMSPAQIAPRKKVKRLAVENFVAVVGNKRLLAITQTDAQAHYEHWQKRIAG